MNNLITWTIQLLQENLKPDSLIDSNLMIDWLIDWLTDWLTD